MFGSMSSGHGYSCFWPFLILAETLSLYPLPTLWCRKCFNQAPPIPLNGLLCASGVKPFFLKWIYDPDTKLQLSPPPTIDRAFISKNSTAWGASKQFSPFLCQQNRHYWVYEAINRIMKKYFSSKDGQSRAPWVIIYVAQTCIHFGHSDTDSAPLLVCSNVFGVSVACPTRQGFLKCPCYLGDHRNKRITLSLVSHLVPTTVSVSVSNTCRARHRHSEKHVRTHQNIVSVSI